MGERKMEIDDIKKEVDFETLKYDTPLDDFVPPKPHYDDLFEKNQQGFNAAYGIKNMTVIPDRDDGRVGEFENKSMKIFAIVFGVVGAGVIVAYWLYKIFSS